VVIPCIEFERTSLTKRGIWIEKSTPRIAEYFLYSSFLDFALQYNISNDNRLILVDVSVPKE